MPSPWSLRTSGEDRDPHGGAPCWSVRILELGVDPRHVVWGLVWTRACTSPRRETAPHLFVQVRGCFLAEPPIGIEPMTYSLRGSCMHGTCSTDRHLPHQPRQFSGVSTTGPRSCMSKMRPRQHCSASRPRPFKSGWRGGGAGTDRSGVRLVGEPLPGCLPGDPQGDRDLVP